MTDITDAKDWEFRIAKLELAPGDVLVVKASKPAASPCWQALRNLLPHSVRVLFIPPDVDLSVLTRAEIEERACD